MSHREDVEMIERRGLVYTINDIEPFDGRSLHSTPSHICEFRKTATTMQALGPYPSRWLRRKENTHPGRFTWRLGK